MTNENDSTQGHKLFKEGPVKALLTRNRPGETSSRIPQYELGFKVLEGPDAGRFITWYGTFSEKNSEKQTEFRKKNLRTVGWDGTREGLEAKFPENEFRITIVTKPAEGEYPAKSEIQYINGLDDTGPQSEPLAPERSKNVADAIFGFFGGAKPAAPANKQAEEIFTKKADSSIPF